VRRRRRNETKGDFLQRHASAAQQRPPYQPKADAGLLRFLRNSGKPETVDKNRLDAPAAASSAVRRDIFVENQTQIHLSPVRGGIF